MKGLLRECYQEAGITGANAKVFENRATAIQQIMNDNNFFEKEDWMLLTKWAIGAVKEDAVKEALVDLEETFCETDDKYANTNTKELHVLVEILLYQYCVETENLLLPSIIVCGYGVGWKLKSNLLYQKFLAFTDETRLALRQLDQSIFAGMINTRVSLGTIKAQLEGEEDEEVEEETDATEEDRIDQLETALKTTEERLGDLRRKSRGLAFALSVQREESNILWWMLTEWSETCQKSYRDMSAEEAALFSAFELSRNVRFSLGPYAAKEILAKMISLGKTNGKTPSSAAKLIDQLEDELQLSFEECQITELQPLLFALDAKRKVANKGKAGEWRHYYDMTCEKDLESLSLTAFDFGRQLYLEIELGRLLHAECDGE